VGYQWPTTTYRLDFTDGRLQGLEVYCRAGSVAQHEAIAAAGDLEDATPDQAMAEITKVFAESLDSWNLDDRQGLPVPATLEGLKQQEPEFVALVVGAWVDAQLARNREHEASRGDREVLDALAEFDHDTLIDHPV